MAKTAFITGSEGAIGRALCRVFKHGGYMVIGLDLRGGDSGCDAFIEADLDRICLDDGYRKGVLAGIIGSLKGQGLDILVNNAALQVVKRTEDLLPDDLRRTMNINLIAPFLLVQGLLPELENAGGSVVNIGSIHARLTKPGFACYAASKAALEGLTRALAVDLGPRVRVNAVSPAAVDTPMLRDGFKGMEGPLRALSDMHPAGRIAGPEEVAHAALFLSSSDAGFITGTCMSLDGGIGSRLHDPE